MRTWVKVTLGGVALCLIGLVALGGTGAYFVFRHMETRQAAEVESLKTIETVKSRFASKPPLIDIIDPSRANFRINRPTEPSTATVTTLHIVNWENSKNQLMTTDVPLWLMQFSSINILSRLGLAPSEFRLTVADIERYGPGIIVDYGYPGRVRVLVWVD